MYGPKSWGGSVDPFILTRFDKVEVEGDQDPIVSFVVFEWRDVENIGKLQTPEAEEVRRPILVLL